MLLFADFLPLPPLTLPTHCQGPQRLAGERTCRTRKGPLRSSPGSPGARWDQGMERMSAEGSPFPEPSRPHARGTGREAFPPTSLPPSLLGNGEKTGSGELSPPAGWGEGEGAALQFPPDQQGPVWGEGGERGRVGSPAPTHIPDGVSALRQHHPDTAQTCPYPGAMNVPRWDFSPLTP